MARRTSFVDWAFTLLLPAVVILHLLVAPYTKVEESFNIQATHDVLVHGVPTSDVYHRLSTTYDHFTFPGAVPRTFVGPVLLAGLSQPIINYVGFEHAQTVVRLVLGLFNAWALVLMKRSIHRAHGSSAARWYAVMQASQFHIMFYASRTLPNMFAFGLTTIAYSLLLPDATTTTSRARDMSRRIRLSISLLVFAAVIFRSEVALLLFTVGIFLLLAPLTHLEVLIPPFLVSSAMALLISVPLDSYFWQRPLWPELWGFHYNAVLNKASDWGTSPAWWYFTSALPRLLLNPVAYLLLIPVAWRRCFPTTNVRLLVVPTLLFVLLYSAQPHKEARFVFYAVPPLTAAAALGADHSFKRRGKNFVLRVASLLLVASVLASFAASVAMALVSSLNYPGGEALSYLRHRVENPAVAAVEQHGEIVRVHADVLACMTGVTLFGSSSGSPPSLPNSASILPTTRTTTTPRILLDKTEDPTRLSDPSFWLQFDYVLAEDPTTIKGGEWDEIAVVEGFAGVERLRPGMPSSSEDEKKTRATSEVVGKGALIAAIRIRVRAVTGGWWVGPRMVPQVHVLRRVRGGMTTGRGISVPA